MHKYIVRSLLPIALCLPHFASAAETEADHWNLKDLYATNAAWDADSGKLQTQLKEVAGCNGHLGDSVQRFKACMDLSADILKRYARLASFAAQTHDQDTGTTEGLDINQRSDILGSKLEQATSFFRP
jgi:oligoendopeptidase F